MSATPRYRLVWILAVLLTLASALWQRLSGPTHPVRTTVSIGNTDVRLRLTRSHSTSADQPVTIAVADQQVSGEVRWRRYPTSDPWQTVALVRHGDTLEARLPRQPSAGKLEYQLVLRRGSEEIHAPERAVVTRFKDDVNLVLLLTHIGFMFASLLFSARAVIGVFARIEFCRATKVAFWLWVIGGLVLGPAVQKQAFGAWWTGVPFGWDLTDNKTLLAVIAWAIAAWRCGRTGGRAAILVAAFVTFVVFAIPHSVWGSEVKWDAPVARLVPGAITRGARLHARPQADVLAGVASVAVRSWPQ